LILSSLSSTFVPFTEPISWIVILEVPTINLACYRLIDSSFIAIFAYFLLLPIKYVFPLLSFWVFSPLITRKYYFAINNNTIKWQIYILLNQKRVMITERVRKEVISMISLRMKTMRTRILSNNIMKLRRKGRSWKLTKD